jgi:prophage regulatory protein
MTEKYASDKDISERFGVSRQTIWRLLKSDPTFPKPFRLTAGSTRWALSEVVAWENSKRTPAK